MFPGSDNRVDSQVALAIKVVLALTTFPSELFESFFVSFGETPSTHPFRALGRRGCLLIYTLAGQLKRSAMLVVLFPVPAIATKAAITPSSQQPPKYRETYRGEPRK